MAHFTTGLLVAASTLAASSALAEPSAYNSPDAAVEAIIAALDARDADALVAVFGPEARDVALSGDVARDRETWGTFMRAYQESNRLIFSDDGAGATLLVGANEWAFPAPLEKGDDGQWRFDPEAAREDVLERRIGNNELDVMELLQGYTRAQAIYREADRDGDGVREFAAAILSAPGERNGLYWPTEDGEPESPISDFVARAAASGYSADGTDETPEPYLGYYFTILEGQGPDAPGGAYDYTINGNMVAGHAMLAFPAAYGELGIMSFMIGENGQIFEADLGEETLDRATAITQFLPDAEWTPVD
ncbi:DUF2950 family protein [Acuticoccus sp. MNP-M23]|uniref:DUF2950 family protein n=1 Tax=Acuticoccus sp. MNP-M23 TaxID=3072793 RepID=UPI0028159FBA|nr:DUF2950 family protein [Acuticoccus sp. MNP-M23]WMS43849.1 DUF2950 family protein [Acuticoccus sp. MNP-M23]